jgi:hypothetical protein
MAPSAAAVREAMVAERRFALSGRPSAGETEIRQSEDGMRRSRKSSARVLRARSRAAGRLIQSRLCGGLGFEAGIETRRGDHGLGAEQLSDHLALPGMGVEVDLRRQMPEQMRVDGKGQTPLEHLHQGRAQPAFSP